MDIQSVYCYDTPDLFLDCKRNNPGTFTQFSMHVHNLYELDYIASGSGYYYIEGTQYPIFPGCILLIRPIDAHRTHVNTDTLYERATFQFSSELLNEIDPSGTLKQFVDEMTVPQITPPAEYESFFKQLFQGVWEIKNEPEPYQKNSIRSTISIALIALRQLLTASATEYVSTGISISDTIRNILAYINQHLTEEFTLDDLCKRFGISKSYLNKRFKEITGTTLWNYVLIKRLTVARQNIHNGMPIQEAYRHSGFSDYSNFYRCYVKQFNCSPKEDITRVRRNIDLTNQ